MCMWQSAALGGALSFGGSVPVEFGTCWAWLDRTDSPVAAAVTASSEARMMKSRRAIMVSSRFGRSGRRRHLDPYNLNPRTPSRINTQPDLRPITEPGLPRTARSRPPPRHSTGIMSAPCRGRTAMLRRSSIGAAALAALCLTITGAAAYDDALYPNWKGQWTRMGSGNWDPAKPRGAGQQAPLTPEYQAILDASLADQDRGGQGNDPGYRCNPHGMPRIMIGIQPLEIVITPQATYVMLELFNQL